jgi:hypothetical protein
MANAKFIVQMGEEDYRIVGLDGDEGAMVPYGWLATMSEAPDIPGQPPAVYFCLVENPDDDNPAVWCVDSVSRMESEVEECNFPPEVVAAQRKLDEAYEAADAADGPFATETTIDVEATPTTD